MLKRSFVLIGAIVSGLLTLLLLLGFLSSPTSVARAAMARAENNPGVSDTTAVPLGVSSIPSGCIVITEITASVTWTQPCYVVMNTVRVPITAVLTISPLTSTRVHVQKGAQIQVFGRLDAIGGPGGITFTSIISSPELADYWQGIFIDENAVGTRIQSATIQYARIGVDIDDTDNITITSNVFRHNGNGGSRDGAIGGDTDGSLIAHNHIYSCSRGIALHESHGNQILDNTIHDVELYGIIFIEDTTFGGSGNYIADNTIHHCGKDGLRLERGYENIVSRNTIYQSVLLTDTNPDPAGAIYLSNQAMLSVTHNHIYSNGRETNYPAALYIPQARLWSLYLNVWHNVIHDEHTDAIEYSTEDGGKTDPEMTNNALCSVPSTTYELRNNHTPTPTIDARHTWWGTNAPKAGNNYTGSVNVTPWISLNLTISPSKVFANGKSPAIVTLTLRDSAGNTVPPPARGIELTSSLGTLASTYVVVNDAGITTTVLTSSEAGTATVTATAFCNYSVTATVVFTRPDDTIVDVVVIKDDDVGSTSPIVPGLADHKQAAVNDLLETARGYAPLGAAQHRECVYPGDLVTYTIAVVNEGKSTATNVVLTETMTKTMPWHADFMFRDFGWTKVNSQTFTMTLGSLPPRTGVITYFVVRVTDTLPISVNNLVNRICVGSDQKDSYLGDNCNYEDTPICPVPDVTISKSAVPTQVLPGDIVTYTATYSNNGSADAQNVFITDTLPDEMIFGGVVSEIPPLFGPTQTGQLVTWYTPTLLAGHSGSIIFTATVTTTTHCSDTLVNIISITTSTPEYNTANNTYSESVHIIGADVIITKTTPLTQVLRGARLPYTITYCNVGDATAENVIITDTPSRCLIPIEPLTRDVGPLLPGDCDNFILPFTVSLAAPCSTTLTNTVRITTTTPECNVTNNEDHESSVHVIGTDVTITKTTELTQASTGDLLTYTITYANIGSAPAENVVITDTLPPFTRYVTDTSGLTITTSTSRLTWTVGTMPADSTISFTLVLSVEHNIEVCYQDQLTNTIHITTGTPECDYTNNKDSVSIDIHIDCVDLIVIKDDDVGPTSSTVPDPAAGVDKRLHMLRGRIENLLASESPKLYKIYIPYTPRIPPLPIKGTHRECVNPGDLVTYTIPLVNAGPYTATNVVLTDEMTRTMPWHVSYVGGSN
ncbi:MAG: DUF11 domain-containing protein, partial [Chloroflexi bacterium]|nr:DUF11 domain-containing protein [Chloroflexota bacterium]